MVRLLLTSCGCVSPALAAELKRMLDATPGEKRMWYIPTAVLYEGASLGQAKGMAAGVQRQFGISKCEVIDPEYVKGEELTQAIGRLQPNVIYLEMGNTYALRHHLRQSGGDALVRSAAAAGAVCIGSSAGSIVLGKTVQMAFWKDWDDRTAGGTIRVDWTDPAQAAGLDLGGGRSFFPHANGTYGRESWQREQAEKHGHTDHEVVKMADGEGFVIDGEVARYVA